MNKFLQGLNWFPLTLLILLLSLNTVCFARIGEGSGVGGPRARLRSEWKQIESFKTLDEDLIYPEEVASVPTLRAVEKLGHFSRLKKIFLKEGRWIEISSIIRTSSP